MQTPVLDTAAQTTSKEKNKAPSIQKKKKMRWQNNIGQTKEQGKKLQDQINEEEIGNLPKKEFRVLIIKTTLNLKSRSEAQIKKTEEMFIKDLEELKNKQW